MIDQHDCITGQVALEASLELVDRAGSRAGFVEYASDMGYCLDAAPAIPAGSTQRFECPRNSVSPFSTQSRVWRV